LATRSSEVVAEHAEVGLCETSVADEQKGGPGMPRPVIRSKTIA
jgi:hypothetical protein